MFFAVSYIALARITRVHHDIPPATFWLIWFGFLGLIIALLYGKGREVRKRREALTKMAMENGFSFTGTIDPATSSELTQIKVSGIQLDYNPRFRNVLKGTRAHRDVAIFDRTVGGGKNRTTSTIIAFRFARPFPFFTLCNENVLWRMADKLGYKDIDIEGAPEFSKRFFLHAQDESAVRTVFTPAVFHAFEQLPADWNLQVAGTGSWLTFSRPGHIIPPERIFSLLLQIESVVSAFQTNSSSFFG